MDQRVSLITLGVADHPWEVAHNPFWTLAEDGTIHRPGPPATS